MRSIFSFLIALVVALYHRWSSFRSLVLFLALTSAVLLAFAALAAFDVRSTAATTIATAALLVAISGVIAMLIPYAAEIYPLKLRGTGSGVIAASSKFGGIVGAGVGVLGFFDHFVLSALVIAAPMALAAVMLRFGGVETRGVGLEAIQRELAGTDPQSSSTSNPSSSGASASRASGSAGSSSV